MYGLWSVDCLVENNYIQSIRRSNYSHKFFALVCLSYCSEDNFISLFSVHKNSVSYFTVPGVCCFTNCCSTEDVQNFNCAEQMSRSHLQDLLSRLLLTSKGQGHYWQTKFRATNHCQRLDFFFIHLVILHENSTMNPLICNIKTTVFNLTLA